ncbi:putative G-protein coupled receptor Mth-like 3, partial [Stegodyphus mimosarum]
MENGKCLLKDQLNNSWGLKNSCFKIILSNDKFILLENGSAFVNYSQKLLSVEEYEEYEKDGKTVLQIAICADNNHNLLPYSNVHYWLSVVTLSISVICLTLHLAVYAILKKLRNCPGKILMSLSASLLCGHLFLLLGPRFMEIYWLCYLNAVFTYFGYLSAFHWMSVMAFDIHKTFSMTQSRNRNSKTFIKYSLCSWISSASILLISITVDNVLKENNEFRPRYGQPICWFNHRKGLLVFFVVPVTTLLMANVILFAVTAFYVRRISRQARSVSNFTDKTRYFLYMKLTTILGLTWFLGIFAAITRIDAVWYAFIILNGLQGAFIFIAFTLKKSILNMLVIKLKIRSVTYRMGKPSGLKKAMYSSLSNLTTLQTTITPNISNTKEPEMLKAVRKINTDSVL